MGTPPRSGSDMDREWSNGALAYGGGECKRYLYVKDRYQLCDKNEYVCIDSNFTA